MEDECDTTREWVQDELQKKCKGGPVKSSADKKTVTFATKRRAEPSTIGLYSNTDVAVSE